MARDYLKVRVEIDAPEQPNGETLAAISDLLCKLGEWRADDTPHSTSRTSRTLMLKIGG